MADESGGTPNLISRTGQSIFSSVGQLILPADPSRLVMLLTTAISGTNCILYLGSADGNGFEFTLSPGIYTEFLFARHGPIAYLPLYWASSSFSAQVSFVTLRRG